MSTLSALSRQLTSRWTATTTALFISALSLGLLVGTGQFSLAFILVFAAAALAVTLGKVGYLVDYYLLLGALTFPGVLDRIGAVSLTWLRTTFLAVVYVAFLIILLGLRRSTSLDGEGRRVLGIVLAWIAFLGISIAWSLSPVASMRYYPKFVMAGALATLVVVEGRISARRGWRLLVLGGAIFLVISLLAMPFKSLLWPGLDYPFVEGFSGRHQSKYYLVFIAILALGAWIRDMRRAWPLLLAIGSTIILALILQRGAFLALFAGAGTALAFAGPRRASLTILRFGLGGLVAVAIVTLLFFNPAFQEYMFYPSYNPGDFFAALADRDILGAFSMVNFRGRLEYWGTVVVYSPISALGIGFGSTPVLIEQFFGEYNELHSDILQYWVETGFVGYIIYLAMWIVLLRFGWKYRRSSDPLTLALSFTLIGYTVALFAWSFVDHVLDYTHMSGAYLFVVAALLLVRQRELKRQMAAGTTPSGPAQHGS